MPTWGGLIVIQKRGLSYLTRTMKTSRNLREHILPTTTEDIFSPVSIGLIASPLTVLVRGFSVTI